MTALESTANNIPAASPRESFNGYLAGSAQVGYISVFGLMSLPVMRVMGHPVDWSNPVVSATGVAALAALAVGGIAGFVGGRGAQDCHQPLENNIGRGLTVAAAATAGMVALAGFTAHVPPAAPLAAPASSTFNIKSQDCQTTPVQKEIQRLAKAGFKVTCAP